MGTTDSTHDIAVRTEGDGSPAQDKPSGTEPVSPPADPAPPSDGPKQVQPDGR